MDGSVQASRAPHILLVEDHADTLEMLRRMLRWEGYHIITASRFDEAIRTAGETEFDVVICDIELPDGCGWTLLERLKERRSSLSGIAISGHDMHQHIQRSRQAGFSVHLTKPIDFSLLRAEIKRCLRAPSVAFP